MISDSGNRTVFENGFQRDIQEGKGRFDLLPWRAIWQLSKHCEEGALKYGEHNIDRGCPQHLLISSAIRHLVKYMLGWDDEPHLRAALWNVAWALEQTETHPELLDIPYKEPELKYEHKGEPIATVESFEETDGGIEAVIKPTSYDSQYEFFKKYCLGKE